MQIPRLHPDTIEQVKQRADIVDVISEKVVLRKRGKDFVGLCPFHEEKSPSFTVSPNKQMYYCFGCQAGGNVINFLMELGKQSFADVVLDLARRYSVPVQTLEPEQRQELQRQLTLREQLYEILAVTTAFYKHALHQSQGQQALEYLKSERRLSEETIQQFELGYAPAGWETLYRYLVEQKGFSVQLVEQAGLIKRRKESEDRYYDYFRDRLIIPIHDIQGRVIGFGGRTLTDEQPKYLNSPETQLFNKGKTLYALDKAKDAIAKQDKAVIVEGYFDAIALHGGGITNAVASLGTALSLDQVKLLLRYSESKQLVLNFDADKAGTNAAKRAIEEIADLSCRGQIQLRILNLPDGKDADEFLKSTGDSKQFRELIIAAPMWLDWRLQQILAGKNLKQADHYQQVAQEMVNFLVNIVDNNNLIHYLNHCAEILGQGDYRLISLRGDNLLDRVVRHWKELLRHNKSLEVPELVEYILKGNHPKKDKQPKLRPRANENKGNQENLAVPSGRQILRIAEALLLRLYLYCPLHRQTIIDSLEAQDLQFSLSHHRFLWQQILDIEKSFSQQPNATLTPSELISKLQDRKVEFPQEMAQVTHLFYLDEKTERDIDRAGELIRSAIARMEQIMCEKQSRLLLEELEKTNPSTEQELRQKYHQEFLFYKQRIAELEKQCQVSISDLWQI